MCGNKNASSITVDTKYMSFLVCLNKNTSGLSSCWNALLLVIVLSHVGEIPLASFGRGGFYLHAFPLRRITSLFLHWR
jgi:hypothetical protein